MKYTTTTLALLGTTAISALPSTNPLRILPPNWTFEIESIRGPGCPDQGKNGSISRITRPTYGSNTVDGSEIYYWFIAYPWMRVDLTNGPRHTWCQTTVKYTEFVDKEKTELGEGYMLRLHKNGTRGIATFELEEGVTAYWDFAYGDVQDKKLLDTIEITGPASSGMYQKELTSNISYPPALVPLSKCGSGTFTFLSELWVFGDKDKRGVVESEKSVSEELGTQYYGAQQGFSYDWEKCE